MKKDLSKKIDPAIMTIFLVVLIDLLGFGLILPLLPYIAEQFHANPVHIGLLSGAYSLFQFVAGPILGRLSDRYGRKKLLIISQIGSVVGYVILALANSLPLLFLSRIIDGITGGNISIAQAYIADVTTKENRAKAMGLLGAAFGLGFMLGPTLGGFLSRYSFAAPAWFAAGIGIMSVLATTFFLKETVNVTKVKSNPRAQMTWARFTEIFKVHPMGLLIVVFMLASLAFSGMQGTYALWAQQKFSWGPQQIGSMFGYIGVLSIFNQLVSLPFFLKRFGEKVTLKISLPILALGFLLLPLGKALPLHLLAFVFISLGNSLANPTIQSIASENVPKEEYGETLGVLQSGASMGRIFGPVVGAELFYRAGVNTPYYFSSAILLFSGYLIMTQLTNKRHTVV